MAHPYPASMLERTGEAPILTLMFQFVAMSREAPRAKAMSAEFVKSVVMHRTDACDGKDFNGGTVKKLMPARNDTMKIQTNTSADTLRQIDVRRTTTNEADYAAGTARTAKPSAAEARRELSSTRAARIERKRISIPTRSAVDQSRTE